MFNIKSIIYALSLVLAAASLHGCVAAALAPTALTLAAEGVSVHSTGQTITENLKEAILESKAEAATAEEDAHADEAGQEAEVASRQLAPLPPRKPEPPKRDPLMITSQANTIGNFVN